MIQLRLPLLCIGSNIYKIIVDKIIILCYNVFEVKGHKIKPLTKNKIKHKGEKYEKDSKFRNNSL